MQTTFTDVFVYVCLFVRLVVGLWLNEDVSSCFLISVCLLDLIEQKTTTHLPAKVAAQTDGPQDPRERPTPRRPGRPFSNNKEGKQRKDVIVIATEVCFSNRVIMRAFGQSFKDI